MMNCQKLSLARTKAIQSVLLLSICQKWKGHTKCTIFVNVPKMKKPYKVYHFCQCVKNVKGHTKCTIFVNVPKMKRPYKVYHFCQCAKNEKAIQSVPFLSMCQKRKGHTKCTQKWKEKKAIQMDKAEKYLQFWTKEKHLITDSLFKNDLKLSVYSFHGDWIELPISSCVFLFTSEFTDKHRPVSSCGDKESRMPT